MAAKKTATKKPAAKTTAAKTSAAKKPAAKTTAAKTSPAKKPAAKKPAAKKPAAKKPAAKQTAAKKPAAKQTAAKTTAAKKPAAKKPAAKKPAAKKPLFDKKYLDKQRLLLLDERNRYITSATRLKAEADSLVEEREPGDVQFDEESGEGDTLAVERERDLALSAHARAAVEQIDAALARIDAGTYGICLVSGKPIPRQRLNAIPWAAERVEHKAGGF
ncbi:DNA-binding protein [Candidatus Poriferisocius sp.]|uniref:TraR/DksA family transcriptional regulator n=1 Tax=Candidatus Poriferisocius sp. TaxID=3101276 RepID=UPI003B02CC8C